ncbi:MAG: alpha-isopropylmalate synthase regulatory domain-containing protein [Bacteroidota bacterium]
MKITIMDTTLRDGEQTSGVSFTDSEKLQMARLLLEELKVDRLEIASAHVSEGELKAVKRILDWAKKNGYQDRIEILGFVDGDRSLDWMEKADAKVLNLLTKGSRKHCEFQLRKTAEQHLEEIKTVVQRADERGITVNIYLEDWSNGMRDSIDYVFFLLENLKETSINRYMLPDTLGILNPEETFEFCSILIKKYPDLQFDFHAHNDYDLATANVYYAIKAGIQGIHTTLNGLGERAGNVPLSSVIGVVKDHLNLELAIDEKKLYSVSKMVESFSGVRIPQNKPLIGEFVFTQTSGIHADGDNKNNLYFNDLYPERFNRKRTYALGKLAGKASIKKNLEELGIELDVVSMKKLTKRINELGDRKETVTADDLPYIISDVLKNEQIKQSIKIKNYNLSVAAGLQSVATLSIEIKGKTYEQTAAGDGQYDAFMNALWKIYNHLEKPYPKLTDYAVTIPPGGKTDALCHTTITWEMNERSFKTNGLDSDQAIAAIKATIKMLNLIEQR